jgi:hypothetical protein
MPPADHPTRAFPASHAHLRHGDSHNVMWCVAKRNAPAGELCARRSSPSGEGLGTAQIQLPDAQVADSAVLQGANDVVDRIFS